MFASNADVNKQDKNGKTALHKGLKNFDFRNK